MSERRDEDGLLVCPLCERPIPPALESRHHLVPKLKGGTHGPVEILHSICHAKIHTTLTESEIARDFDTVDKLREHPEIAKFVRWVRKRPIDHRSRNRRSRRLR